MGTNFTGITFDDCNVSPSDDGIINRTILPDGILSGCEISYSGSTLTMAAGTLIACGRQFRHPAAQNWAVVDATTGYARLLITLDLTRSATDQTFDQVVDAVEYANDISGFPALVQQDLNAAGTKYQIVACVVSLGPGGISGIVNTMPTVHPASADGGTLTVTAPGWSTVTVSKDGKTLTRVAGADRVVVFRGLKSGTWNLSITDGEQTASKTVEIVADYATSITFFAATINITYPAGSTCTATDGKTTLTAPNTSGTWACVVPNAGTWTISLSNGFAETVSITTNGQTVTIDKWYLYNAGEQRTYITGGWEAQRYASIGNDRLVLNNTASGTQIVTKNKVDITNIKTVYAEMETKNGSGQRDLKFGVSDETGFESYTAKKMVTQEGFNIGDTVILSVDVSSLSGNYYIKLGSYNCGCDIPYVYCK